jgi:hypothetical protein
VRHVVDERSEDAIRYAFDVRLPRWEPGKSALAVPSDAREIGRLAVGVTRLMIEAMAWRQ